jgi:hypothetical protein
MANVPGNPRQPTGNATSGKLQVMGTIPQVTSSGRSGRLLTLGQRFPLSGGVENTNPIAGQIFPRGLD